jgi:hypothetical protein
VSETVPLDAVERPRRARSRARGLIAVVLLVVLVVAAVVLDGVARGYAANLIETKVRSSLSLPASTPVAVTVGGFSVLAQLATGSLERVDVTVDSLPVGDLTGNATLTATGVPIDQSKAIGAARLVFTVDQSQVQKLLAGYGSVPITSLSLGAGVVRVGTAFSVLGLSLPVSLSLAPSAVGGQLVLTPRSVTIGGKALTPSDIRSSFGSVADSVLAPQKICVAEYLPKALRLEAVTVTGSSVQLAVGGSSVVLNDTLLKTKGVCP